MRNNPQQRHLLATAGNENALKLWSLERPASPIFISKNVRNDIQRLMADDELF